jgi:Tfp pilus assembly protein PilF
MLTSIDQIRVEVDLSSKTLLTRRILAVGLLLFVNGLATAQDEGAKNRAKESKLQVGFGIEVAQLGLWREAIYRWEKAVELDPTNASARNNLAVAYEQSGRFDEANVEYEKALELDANNIYIRQNYELFREAYERKKRTDERSSQD